MNKAQVQIEVLLRDRATGGLRNTKTELDNVSRSAGELDRKASGASTSLKALGAAVSIAAVAAAARGLFTLSAGAAEVRSALTTTFGAQATKQIDEFNKSFANMAGLTRTESARLATSIGAMTKGLGASSDGAVDLSKKVLTLAGDLASFRNLKTEEAFSAITSVVSGASVEPLQRFGIIIRAAAVDALALQLANKKNASELTDLERATARVELITRQLGSTNGDLERTSGSAANQAKQLEANLKEIAETAGKALLPALSDVVVFLKAITDTLRSDDGTVGFAARLAGLVSIVGTVAVAISGIVTAVGALAAAFGAVGFPVFAAIAAIAVFIGLVEQAFKSTRRAREEAAEARADLEAAEKLRARFEERAARNRPVQLDDIVVTANRPKPVAADDFVGQLGADGRRLQAQLAFAERLAIIMERQELTTGRVSNALSEQANLAGEALRKSLADVDSSRLSTEAYAAAVSKLGGAIEKLTRSESDRVEAAKRARADMKTALDQATAETVEAARREAAARRLAMRNAPIAAADLAIARSRATPGGIDIRPELDTGLADIQSQRQALLTDGSSDALQRLDELSNAYQRLESARDAATLRFGDVADTMRLRVRQLLEDLPSVGAAISDALLTGVTGFVDRLNESMVQVIQGSKSLGKAFGDAVRAGVAAAAKAQAAFFRNKAIAALGEALLGGGPAALLAAAKFTAASIGFAALAGSLGSSGGGSGGGGGAASEALVGEARGTLEVNLASPGLFIDASNPRSIDQFRDFLDQATDRKVVIRTV